MARLNNPRFPHTCRIYRTMSGSQPASEDPDVDEWDESSATETEVYRGKCRSYNLNTTSDRGEVITNIRVLALPVKQDEWTVDSAPHKDDRVCVDKLAFSEEGVVIDVRPNNLGTDILWRYNG